MVECGLGILGVVLSRWGGGGPWLGGYGGLSLVRSFVGFYMAMFCSRGARLPSVMGTFSWLLMHLALALLAFYINKIKYNLNIHKYVFLPNLHLTKILVPRLTLYFLGSCQIAKKITSSQRFDCLCVNLHFRLCKTFHNIIKQCVFIRAGPVNITMGCRNCI